MNESVKVDTLEECRLTDPVFLEGLPGVGQIGQLVAEELIDSCDGVPVRRVTSEYFPAQITYAADGEATIACVTCYAISTDAQDVLILSGGFQPETELGQYRLADALLDIAESFGTERVITVGGVPTGNGAEDPTVIGAVTPDVERSRYIDAGVEFRPGEPAGGIVGTSGMLVGLSERRDMPAACLMGETPGNRIDHRSAAAVLSVIGHLLEINVAPENLRSQAGHSEQTTPASQNRTETDDQGTDNYQDLRYFD